MKKLNDILSAINLRLFDGEGSQEASSAGETSEEVVVYGKQQDSEPIEPVKEDESTEPTVEENARDFDKEFEDLIKGDFKKQYDDRVHKNIAGKTAQINKLKTEIEATNEKYSPLIKVLSMKYGVQDGNIESLVQAIESDNASYEQEAYEKNMTVEQLKHLKQIEAENEEFKRMSAEANNKMLAAKQVDE